MTDLGTYPSSSYILGPNPKADRPPSQTLSTHVLLEMPKLKPWSSLSIRVCLHLTQFPENSTLAEDTSSAPLGPSFLLRKREVTSFLKDIKKNDRTRHGHVAGIRLAGCLVLLPPLSHSTRRVGRVPPSPSPPLHPGDVAELQCKENTFLWKAQILLL